MPLHSLRFHSSATSDLVKAFAFYLIAISLIQSLAAAFALGAGPLHRHRPVAAGGVSTPLFAHQARAVGPAHFEVHQARPHHAEMHTHAQGVAERHHHDAGDQTVMRDAAGQDSAEAAATALTTALSLLALQTPRVGPDLRVHVLAPARSWVLQVASKQPIDRPPDLN